MNPMTDEDLMQEVMESSLVNDIGTATVGGEGGYTVQYTGEKFKIAGGLKMVKENSQNIEEMEMQKALDQIREMEEKEVLEKKDQDVILEYLK